MSAAAGVICCRCDGDIGSGEPYETLLRHSMSGPGTRMHRHTRCPDESSTRQAALHAAWGKLMTHLGACAVCLSDEPGECVTGRRLREEWRAAERDAS
ncbi:hypothetical protein ACIBCB_26080 [Streptomyces uncialis]|uniref:hypothetical protein n=1 Tax=Streptomyces uncialis TaxID=1048205 RepID=UPI0037BB96A6